MEPKLKKKSLFKRIVKNQLLVTVITGIFLLMMIIGSSYAVFNQKVFNTENDVIIQSGNLEVVISSQSEMIEMNYTTLGVSDEVGLSYAPYTFTVENTGNADIAYYEIRIVDKEYENSTLPHKSLNFSIAVNNSDYQLPQNLGDNDSYIYVGNDLSVGETDSFNLKLWVNEEWGKYANNKTLKASIEVTLYSENPTRNYIVYDSQGGNFVPKTSIFSKRITQKVPKKLGCEFIGWSTSSNGKVEYESNDIYISDVGIILYAKYEGLISYNLNGGVGDIPSNRITEGITSVIPNREGYIFLGWAITSDAIKPDYSAGDTYSGDAITLYAVWQEVRYLHSTIEKSLMSNLTTEDSNGNKYVYGNVENNYVWYSGKLWRIVSINSDGTLKLVTQWNMTNIPFYGQAFTNVSYRIDYDESQVRTWLNNIFLPTLNSSLIIESAWNYNENGTINEKVGLLSSSEFDRSLKNNITYLNNGYKWMTMDEIEINGIQTSNLDTTSWLGIRPVIQLKHELEILNGEGTENDPYRLANDIVGQKDDLLNSRFSGEYINFNNTLYRIITTETIDNHLLTKVTMADYSINNNTIGNSASGTLPFSSSNTIGKYLTQWYENSILANYKDMVVTTGIKWSVEFDDTMPQVYDYTLVLNNKNVEATIGLPYYGEIFASHFDDISNISTFHFITSSSGVVQFYMDEGGLLMLTDATFEAGVRPCFYLKSDVKIVSGSGLPNDPYELQ